MDILATLRRSGGIDALARQLGQPPVVATAGVEALMPCLVDGFRRHGSDLEAFLDTLDELGGDSLAAEVMSVEPAHSDAGYAILDAILPDGTTGESVNLSSAGSLDPDVLDRMRPLLAMLIGGYVVARARGSGLTAAEYEALFDTREETALPEEEE